MANSRAVRACRLLAVGSLALLSSGCTALKQGFLTGSSGFVASAERHEFVIVGIFLLFVIAPVLLLTPLIAWHYRLANTKSAFRPQWGFNWILEALIWLPPTAIVVALSVLLWNNTKALDPYKSVPGTGAPLQIEVVSLDWKWLFIYPDQHIATVNQLIVPVGQPIELSLTSGTVMQSLLMPQLAGQIYAMAGMTSKLNFSVAHPGQYLGENTQYNGDGFAHDKFIVRSIPPAAYNQWLSTTQTKASVLDAQAYQDLSRQSVLTKPETFGQVAPDLFKQIVGGSITPGYALQHHEIATHG